ncbi:7280_t:CDS:1, partial [Racocetra persica]
SNPVPMHSTNTNTSCFKYRDYGYIERECSMWLKRTSNNNNGRAQ